MKKFIYLLAILATSANAQTIKTLGYDTTNGRVSYSGSNSLTFTNALQFTTNTRAATRTNLGGTTVGNAVFTATNAAAAATAIGLGATNTVFFNTVSVKESGTPSATSFNGIQWRNMYPSSNGLIALYGSDDQGTTTFGINIGTGSEGTTQIALFNAYNIIFYKPLTFNNPTNAALSRDNLGLGATWLTNTNVTNFRTAIGLGTASTATFNSLQLGGGGGSLGIGGMELDAPDSGLDLAFKRTGTTNMVLKTNGLVLHVGSYSFSSGNTDGAAITRTNLGLGATWLTNSASPLFWTSVPATSTNSGTAGAIAYSNNHLYICISNN